MDSADKVLVLVLAAHEILQKPVSDPLIHSLVYELKLRGWKFPTYYFRVTASRLESGGDFISHSMSRELDKDLSILTVCGRLKQHWLPILSYSSTARGRRAKPELYDELKCEENCSCVQLFAILRELFSDPHTLLRQSYERLVAETVSGESIPSN